MLSVYVITGIAGSLPAAGHDEKEQDTVGHRSADGPHIFGRACSDDDPGIVRSRYGRHNNVRILLRNLHQLFDGPLRAAYIKRKGCFQAFRIRPVGRISHSCRRDRCFWERRTARQEEWTVPLLILAAAAVFLILRDMWQERMR